MTLQRRVAAWAAFVSVVALSQPIWAQKNSGPLLPIEPVAPMTSAPAYRPRPAPYAAPRPAPMTGPTAGPGHNPQVERLADRLPIDPQTRDLRDQLPRDTRATERSLGLHPARGPVTDLRGHTPSPGEIANALAPR